MDEALHGRPHARPERIPILRYAARVLPARSSPANGRRRPGWVHVPDAPRGPLGSRRHVSEVRHGAGTGDGDRRSRGGQPRAPRHDPPALDRRGSDGARPRARHERSPARRLPLHLGTRGVARLRRARDRDARLHLGGVAVLRASGPVGREPQPEHVHAHRARRERRVRLQHRGHPRAGDLPGVLPRCVRPRRRVLRGRDGHRDAHLAGTGARAARAQPNQRGD